ncbi:hypothetical protein G7B40_014060 [Aetokthonos hydrillicola Thurmond2011]|jgi:hypothetical protein|uniref:Uncharacterized protein n=1 Tax=Aetokthonos hydrillicola Thurmond2011 TaxID=2712845 RepID=A0AAP5MAJ6_9CYAN|nr:hypothetical protein [Aetokthonos hydrillicola]MBO3460951.1 hypothetical protein [Aetokthonos hydrillicola CCALA 1050]MBW4583623.1 hypothetical protein [Aetokthonos hydrillicola CCALA 1050]MDR9895684.1 hypothetical protein [Aetokthonos hydrillicola Thurmond2011]
MNITLYGLLHLVENQYNAVNVTVTTFEEQRNIYIKNAINLSLSLKKRGIPFILLTNRKEEICDQLKNLGHSNSLSVQSLNFSTKVSDGTRFYSAHFKLDVFSYFASLDNEQYVGLVDLDMISIANVPVCLKNIIQEKIPLCYDISDQVIPAYSHDVIIQDMLKVSPHTFEGRWSGGEFITGSPPFFASLDAEIRKIYPRYIEIADTLHHQSDEMPTSIALETLRRNGKYIADAGTLGIVGRFWSVPTFHEQKSFRSFQNSFLLHLPADKKFLAKVSAEQAQCPSIFIKTYNDYLFKKSVATRLRNTLKFNR